MVDQTTAPPIVVQIWNRLFQVPPQEPLGKLTTYAPTKSDQDLPLVDANQPTVCTQQETDAVTLEDVAKSYLARRRGTILPETHLQLARSLDLATRTLALFGAHDLDEIDQLVGVRMLRHLTSRTGENLAPATALRVVNTLAWALYTYGTDQAMDKCCELRKAAAAVKRTPRERRYRTWPTGKLRKVVDSVVLSRLVGLRSKILFALVGLCGARPSELARMLVGDLDFGSHRITFRTLKGKRTEGLPVEVLKLLAEYLCIVDDSPNSPLFEGNFFMTISPRSISWKIQMAAELVGVETTAGEVRCAYLLDSNPIREGGLQ
jgi:integrase